MSWPLFKSNIKTNITIWIVMTLIFIFYFSSIGSVYDPQGSEALNDMMKIMPEELINAFGFGSIGTTLLTMLISFMYGMLLFMFPLVISIVVNHRILAKHIDRGSMTYMLCTTNSRKKIAFTQALFSLASITAFFIFVTVFGILICEGMFPGELEIGKFIFLNFYALLMYFAIGGIGFFASCVATESKHSLGLGIGIPVGFLLLQMLGNSTSNTWIGNLSLYALFEPSKLVEGDSFIYIGMAAFILIAAALYAGGIAIFNKRDLYI